MINNLKSALNDFKLNDFAPNGFTLNGVTLNNFTLNQNSKRRQATLKSLDRLAWLLDNSIAIPLTRYRIGLESILGLIPVFGDIAGLLLSAFIVVQAMRLGTPGATLMLMIKNIAFELIFGAIPIVGDVFDATYKANLRNVRLVREAVG